MFVEPAEPVISVGHTDGKKTSLDVGETGCNHKPVHGMACRVPYMGKTLMVQGKGRVSDARLVTWPGMEILSLVG